MDWTDKLTEAERKRLEEIDAERDRLTHERRRIYDRCRRRTVSDADGVRFTTKQGYTFVVDEDDVERIAGYNWNALSPRSGRSERFQPYIQGVKKGDTKVRVYLHRLLMSAPKGKVVDHIDGNPLNNTKENLRIVTQRENMKHAGESVRQRNGFAGVR